MKKYNILLFLVWASIGSVNAQCSTTAVRSPSIASDVFQLGKVEWFNENQVFTSNNLYTVSTALLLGDSTQTLVVRGFGFSIPSTATICGIRVNVEKSRDGIKDNVKDGSVKIIKGGTITGTEHRRELKWPRNDSIVTYGGPADLWGTTWTYNEINSSGFGVSIGARLQTDLTLLEFLSLPILPIAKIDHVTITVFYSNPLPIELLGFNAVCNDEDVLVSWQVASQMENDFYTVERSTDAVQYQAIGTVEGLGTTNVKSEHSFTDLLPLEELTYYRLKQTDFNGAYTYFGPVSVDCRKPDLLTLQTNAETNEIVLSFKYKENEQYRLKIYNAYGQLVRETDDIHSDKVRIERGNLSNGIYLVILEGKDKVIGTEKMILR